MRSSYIEPRISPANNIFVFAAHHKFHRPGTRTSIEGSISHTGSDSPALSNFRPSKSFRTSPLASSPTRAGSALGNFVSFRLSLTRPLPSEIVRGVKCLRRYQLSPRHRLLEKLCVPLDIKNSKPRLIQPENTLSHPFRKPNHPNRHIGTLRFEQRGKRQGYGLIVAHNKDVCALTGDSSQHLRHGNTIGLASFFQHFLKRAHIARQGKLDDLESDCLQIALEALRRIRRTFSERHEIPAPPLRPGEPLP